MTISLHDAAEQHGTKAAHLGRLLRDGFDLPPGVVVDPRDEHWESQLEQALRDLGAGPFAVRSSALCEDGHEASFAGQLTTALDVAAEQVADEVRRVARSGVDARAAAYAARTGHGPVSAVPVIVQVMVRPEAAGVLFTRHPVTGAHQIVIEAARGLGDGVAGGTVDPETWTVDSKTITRSRGASDRVLSETQVRSLAESGRQIEAVFGRPQDVEWAVADDVVWVLQARSATALPQGPRKDHALTEETLVTGTPAGPGRTTGIARVIENLDDFSRMRPGDVLVCRTTSPAWTPLLARAAAVVTATGGVLAHASIVAREFGIPAVVGAAGAMTALRDGQRVVVDGTTGTVARSEHPGEDQ